MELLEKDYRKDAKGQIRYYLNILFNSGKSKKIEVNKETFTKEEYKKKE
jgi:hypothetical protein